MTKEQDQKQIVTVIEPLVNGEEYLKEYDQKVLLQILAPIGIKEDDFCYIHTIADAREFFETLEDMSNIPQLIFIENETRKPFVQNHLHNYHWQKLH